MRFKLKQILITFFPIAVIVVGCIYVYRSRSNPYVFEIIFGSVAVSVLLGVLSSLTQRHIDKRIEGKPGKALLLIMVCLIGLIAFLVAFSNEPADIKGEIPVMYLVDPNTKELVSGLIQDSTTASVCYMEAQMIFKKFREKRIQDVKELEQSLGSPYFNKDTFVAWKYFHNLTEYLISYYIAGAFTTPEADRTTYRGETGDWLGLPDLKIGRKSIAVENIAGDFKNNVFHGMKGWQDTKRELALPKNTNINLVHEDGFTSKFIIKNKYIEITIGVRILPMESQGPAFVYDKDLLPYTNNNWEGVKGFKCFQTMIYYDVIFSKWRYSFQDMKHYERWANSLFSFLQRCFAWGNPPVLNNREMLRLIRQYERQTKEQLRRYN